MRIKINNTKHVTDEVSWPEILPLILNMLRVEGFTFTDEDVIAALDEKLDTKVREEMYAEGYDDCINHINGDLVNARIVRTDEGYTIQTLGKSGEEVREVKSDLAESETVVDSYGAERTYSVRQQGHGGTPEIGYEDLERARFSYRD